MDMNRRDAMKIAAAAVSGMVTVRTNDDRPMVVIAFHQTLSVESMNAMREQLRELGVYAALINAAPAEVAVADKKRTFFSLANGDRGQVFADGREVHAVWIDTESGIWGMRCDDGSVEMRRAKSFKFVPRRKAVQA